MDDYLFEDYLGRSKYLPEANSYVEILNYSDSQYDVNEQHLLEDSELQNFLHRRGAFAPAKVPAGVKLISGMRLICQIDAKQLPTFRPDVITLPHNTYRDMVKAFKLSPLWIESSAAVGPHFWSCWDHDEENPHLQIIYRKSDVVKVEKTRGWELALSHGVSTGITQGFFKGTNSSDIKGVLKHLHHLNAQVGHAMILPMVIFGHDMAQNIEKKQRDLRHESRKLENAISLRGDINPHEGFVVNGIVDYDIINQHIIECSTQVLWKKPESYQGILDGFRTTFADLWTKMPEERLDTTMQNLNRSLLSRIAFYYVRLDGMKEYAETTVKRLEVQRHALEMNTSRRENKLNLEIANQQKQLIHTTKRETEGQKTIATLGIIFLPPTVISGIFSTTFFNFAANDPNGTRVVSTYFWVFWAITIPVTAMIFFIYFGYTQYQKKKHLREDQTIVSSIEDLERKIQKEMRVATIARLDTFNKKEEGVGQAIGGPGTKTGSAKANGLIASAIAGSGREGASLIGVLPGKTRTDTVPIEKVFGEATLPSRTLELRPSGRLSVHSIRSRSPSRGRRGVTPEPNNRKMLSPRDAEAASGTSDDTSQKEKEAAPEPETKDSSKKNIMTRRKTTAPLQITQNQTSGPEINDDRAAVPGVNGRRFPLNWVPGFVRRMGRNVDEELGDGGKKSGESTETNVFKEG